MQVFPGKSPLAVAIALSAIAAFYSPPLHSADPALPRVRVDSVRRIFHNGEHNAFTDLIRYKGVYYLTFRSCPDGHMVHPTSSIIVLSSRDGVEWRQSRIKFGRVS
jgi:hypothetical protein